jgi:sterol desaturase/sphingolipid hydroxylase (fatty acid hydroxylase superfamily)
VKRGDRLYFTAAAALVGFALGYALPVYARLPTPYYDPLARRWGFGRDFGAIPMGYLGLVAWGLAGALLAAALIALVAGRARTPPSERAYVLAAAWALAIPALVVAYFTWNNWP